MHHRWYPYQLSSVANISGTGSEAMEVPGNGYGTNPPIVGMMVHGFTMNKWGGTG